MQRKVAYLFLYKNGIRERSVGILRRYDTANQPEVALELFGEEVRKRKWKIYYFTKGEALAEATYLWGTTTERGKSEARLSQCRLCAEAGTGEGIVLLPERSDLREYLCARYDGKEMSEEELWGAFHRKAAPELGENPCIESAKKLMEEITRVAGGDTVFEGTEKESGQNLLPVETGQNESERFPIVRKRRIQNRITYLEELLLSKPPYVPCRRYDVEYSVRITPEDLLHLPKEGKGFTENSYLLHGYYRYRHVLLGRRRRKEREDYVILVPGIYDRKEAGLAELFGFSEFLPIHPETGLAASGKGLFGYFCGKI